VAEVSYLTLGDYCRIAAEVLGTTSEQVARLPRIALADSALATPQAGFGDHDAYPGLIEKAAVLVEHLARNHPLPGIPAAFVGQRMGQEARQFPADSHVPCIGFDR
jgi:death-on-curing protein